MIRSIKRDGKGSLEGERRKRRSKQKHKHTKGLRSIMAKKKAKNPITKVRTGTGDDGTTFLKVQGVSKTSPAVDFVGTLDEACAAMALCELTFDFGSASEADIQRELDVLFQKSIKAFFMMGAMVHSEEAKTKHLPKLENLRMRLDAAMKDVIDNEFVDPLDGFIVPNPENAQLFLARAIVRRAERDAIHAGEMELVPFLNTLSDFIFVVSWHISHYYETWTGFVEDEDDL